MGLAPQPLDNYNFATNFFGTISAPFLTVEARGLAIFSGVGFKRCGASVMSLDHKTHDALVANWQENAEDNDDDNYLFLRSLKDKSGKKVDRIALELHHEAFGIVECTKCANCCRTLHAVVTEQDIERIAGHLEMARDAFVAAYLEQDEEPASYRTKTTPCPFLGEDSKCTIYDVRPKKCQGYPFTDKPDFASSTINHANNAVVCPAVFYVVEQMKLRLQR